MGYLNALRRYSDFSGRSTRTEYLTFFLVEMILIMFGMILDGKFNSHSLEIGRIFGLKHVGPISVCVISFHLLPGLTLSVRRLHDMGRSGWWRIVPFANTLLMLWGLFSVDFGPNRFGDDPRDQVKPRPRKPGNGKSDGPRRFRGVRYGPSPSRPPNYDPENASTTRFI